ncbi:hypothetical protein BGX31_000861 [Mortierella sp. GBA43]|nr:hypothetical protein BGX31_000861 [Mortierella sp. GBA43]
MESHFKVLHNRRQVFYMDFCGWKGVLNTLYTHKGISFCKTVGTVTLPTTKEDLSEFLIGGSFRFILLFKEHIERSLKGLNHAEARAKAQSSKGALRVTLPIDSRAQLFGEAVMLTPTKNKKFVFYGEKKKDGDGGDDEGDGDDGDDGDDGRMERMNK